MFLKGKLSTRATLNYKMKSIFKIILACGLLMGMSACSGSGSDPEPKPVDPVTPVTPVTPEKEETINKDFVTGGDISWLTEMEDNGVKFYSRTTNAEGDCMSILKELGMKAVRFRVWVNPKTKYNGLDDVVKKAVRAKGLGLKIMIDFHYSDTWADPAHQDRPVEWQKYSDAELVSAVSSHTTTVLQTLKDKGVDVTWVQVGNETSDGMFYPTGQISKGNGKNFASFVNAGYDAAKKVYPSSKVIVHVNNGDDLNLSKYVFDALKDNNGKWDMIGLSLYPNEGQYKAKLSTCVSNVEKLYEAYKTPVMICEVGMSRSAVTQCKEFLSNFSTRLKELSDQKCAGVFYWEPEDYKGWNGGYTKGAFTDDGYPNDALVAFYKI